MVNTSGIFFRQKNEMSNFTLTCFDCRLHSSSEVWLARRWTSPCDVLWRRESQVWSRQGFSWKVTLQFVTWRFHLVPHLSQSLWASCFDFLRGAVAPRRGRMPYVCWLSARQTLMQLIFGDQRCRSLLLYLDNIVVFSSNIENTWRGCIAWRWQPQRPWF